MINYQDPSHQSCPARLLALSRSRLHFSVAVGDTGATRMLTPRVWHVAALSLLPVAMATFGALAFFSGADVSENYALKSSLSNTKNALVQTEGKLATLQDELAFKDRKIQVFAHELGTIQARLERFETIGEQLFKDEYFGKYLAELDGVAPVGSPDAGIPPDPVSVFAMATQLASVKRRTGTVENVFETTDELLTQTQLKRSLKPHHWPVVHERSYVSSRYGWRKDPVSGDKRWHSGMDVAAAYNAPIVASADGVVTFAGYRFGYGIMVEVTHGGGMVTRYAHLNRAIVHNNQSVKAGELVGLMGSTGRSTGPHLHFELIAGDHKIDPYPFIKDGRKNAKMLAQSDIDAYDPSRF